MNYESKDINQLAILARNIAETTALGQNEQDDIYTELLCDFMERRRDMLLNGKDEPEIVQIVEREFTDDGKLGRAFHLSHRPLSVIPFFGDMFYHKPLMYGILLAILKTVGNFILFIVIPIVAVGDGSRPLYSSAIQLPIVAFYIATSFVGGFWLKNLIKRGIVLKEVLFYTYLSFVTVLAILFVNGSYSAASAEVIYLMGFLVIDLLLTACFSINIFGRKGLYAKTKADLN